MTATRDMTVHMIGHGHIDPTWLWRWTEGYEEVRATFRSALDRMNETRDFRFTASSACFYAWVEQCDPDMFEEIKARVAEGRWELAGGWWIEPDCNVPCGESFVRQGLYAQRFFQRAFGKTARVGFNPDSFGHAAVFPQILKKLGLDYYVYMRPQPVYEMTYPEGTTFWWEAPDGSRVLASNIPISYNADEETTDRIRALTEFEHLNEGQRHVLGFYGVGNHGGGPTKNAICRILAADEDTSMPAAKLSTLGEYFAAFEAEGHEVRVPTVRDELQHHARGCYSVHTGVKYLNRRAEHALMNAERLGAVAWLLGVQPYPAESLTEGWRDVLYNQFHDILAGTSIESSYEDTRDQVGGACHRANASANLSLQSIAREIDTTPEGNTVVVFNPLPWPVQEPVTVSPIVERTLGKTLHLVNDEGRQVPFQAVRGDQVGAKRYAFNAEIPSLGYRCYHVREGEAAVASTVTASEDTLENAWWRVRLDRSTGQIAALFDKTAGVQAMSAPMALVCLNDPSDTWSHGVDGYDQEAGRFADAKIVLAESGAALGRLRSHSKYGASEAIIETTLYAGVPYIDLCLRINWHAAYQTLKLAVRTNVKDGAATYETPYGHQTRPLTGEEEPGQQWIDLTGNIEGVPYGLTILNDGQYSFDISEGLMRVTLLRSPAYAHHDPAPFDPDAGYTLMDQGWHTVRVRLMPHAGALDTAAAAKAAWAFNAPPLVHHESAHGGERPAKASFLSASASNVMLTVAKQSEDGEELILRARECAGQACRSTLWVLGKPLSEDPAFSPFEIKTLRLRLSDWDCREVSLLET